MNGYPLLEKCRMSASRGWEAIQRAVPGAADKAPRIRISFDIDDTLACQPEHSDVEPNWLAERLHSSLTEPLRIGTRALTRELRRQGCSIWVYTSSGRTPSYIRRWLLLYGIRVDGVVNSVLHNEALAARGLSNSPSKLPPAFDIDLHVDDSEGVRMEGHDYGFRVVVVDPQDEHWAQKVLDAVAVVQAQVARQHSLDHSPAVAQGARAVYS